MLQMAHTKLLQSRAFLLHASLTHRPTRWCLTPAGMSFGSLLARLPGATPIVRLGRDGSEDWPNEGGSGSCRLRQGTEN